MKVVTLQEAEAGLEALLQQAAGEEILSEKEGKTLARLVAVEPYRPINRKPGAWRSYPGW